MTANMRSAGAELKTNGHRSGVRQSKSAGQHGTRNGLICTLVVAACLWSTWPVAEIGFIDDWSYAKTALVFAQTGHFVYNGWATAMLGWQVVWAALFIKLFGFSFTAVRLSMLPYALATVFLFHAILVRFGVNPRNAVLGTLTLGLSPLFMPLAVSYMTDVPGLFAVVLCLYLCQRAVAAGSSRTTIAWLCLAAASNVVGGTARQIAWLGALVMVPSAGWLLRRRRDVLPASLLIWAMSVAGVFVTMGWFARQPYSIPEPLLDGISFRHTDAWFPAFVNLLGAPLCLLLLLCPILIAWLPEVRILKRIALARIAFIMLACGFFQTATKWTMPWIYHVIQSEFSSGQPGELHSLSDMRLLSVPTWAQQAMSLLVIGTGLVFGEYLCSRIWPSLRNKTLHLAACREILWLLGPFTVSYVLLLMPRAYHLMLFDRYLLPIMPIAIICLLRLHQHWLAETLPPVSVIALATFALLAIAGTHDWFSWYRAHLAAIQELRASGVPRTEIQGGTELDGWTQIENDGYINEPRLKVPSGAYRPDTNLLLIAPQCRLNFALDTPVIHAKFTIAFPKMWCLAPSNYPSISYRTWLPPYNRAIYVQTIPDASH